MKHVAIIGGGIIGATAAFYLSHLPGSSSIATTLFDDENGQATKAAAGIISPWLSKRRNRRWYELAKRGAELMPQLAEAAHLGPDVYQQTGTIVTRKNHSDLIALFHRAEIKRQTTPAMGKVALLSSSQVGEKLPFLTHPPAGVFVSGGAKVEGAQLVNRLLAAAQRQNLTIIHHRGVLRDNNRVDDHSTSRSFDDIIIASGAWMKETLAPLHLSVDIRPQKGQLIDLSLKNWQTTTDLPVMMPDASSDIIPFADGRLVIGATHEDDGGFDLKPTAGARKALLHNASQFMSNLNELAVLDSRVGTRAYTSDYGPFFGGLPTNPHILVGGGLGSSGLTTGPMIGYFLANQVLGSLAEPLNRYTKPVGYYIH
ncbi:oxidoreductase [Lentilactobacillus fungorum]|uniref:Oxidoreductase n=1 Tax=Lentilactobacillus fungorum TaxID=2201250 RepID=A0ABQ3VX39_9LACO|nr:oxidoreductase [Lentilactobacillus fungorum]